MGTWLALKTRCSLKRLIMAAARRHRLGALERVCCQGAPPCLYTCGVAMLSSRFAAVTSSAFKHTHHREEQSHASSFCQLPGGGDRCGPTSHTHTHKHADTRRLLALARGVFVWRRRRTSFSGLDPRFSHPDGGLLSRLLPAPPV